MTPGSLRSTSYGVSAGLARESEWSTPTALGCAVRPAADFRYSGQTHRGTPGVDRSAAPFLESPVSRNVFDRTGLQGTFDVELQYVPDLQIGGPNAPAVEPTGGSIFTAVRDQLGLKLESAKAPVDVLVIDRVERLTPD